MEFQNAQAAPAPDATGVELNIEKPAEMANQAEYKARLRAAPEVQNLTNEINIQDPGSILIFGQKPSEGISKISDQILSTMKAVKAEEAGEMMTQLTKIMDKFDLKEIEEMDKQGIFEKLFQKVKDKVDKLFKKYDDLGREIDKVAVILKKYESDIQKVNADLEKLYNENIKYYQALEKYIVAGEMGQEEIEAYKQQVLADPNRTPEEKTMVTQKLDQVKDMLNQRVYDLQVAENVAMQACPMIQTMLGSNYNLQRKINSSFIITLPVFKQAIIQAINLKRVEIQARSIQQLDQKTNELLLRNAQNTATQSVKIAEMAGGSSIKMETLRETYAAIQRGIEETKAMNEQQAKQRAQDAAELENMKQDMKSKGFAA